MIPFVKGHGLGNDYIVIKGDDLPSPLTAKQTVRICDRNWGAGSDGILLKVPGWAGGDFGLRSLKREGGEPGRTGNARLISAT
jgi:diaminopimelate epimerase